MQKVGIVVDLGNSETRVGIFLNGKFYEKDIANTFAALPAKYSLKREYINEDTIVFKLDKGYYAHGKLVEMEFLGRALRPSSLEAKTDQLVTRLSLVMVLYTAQYLVAKELGVALGDVHLDIDFTIALPPLEHDISESKMADLIRGIDGIDLFSPRISLPMTISNVKVVPEAVTAFFGAFYEEINGSLGEYPLNAPFSEGYVLIIDIGAGTTDVALVKDTELQLESKDTFKIGGNQVESLLLNEVKRQELGSPSESAIKEAVRTGFLTLGQQSIDMSETLESVKQIFSQKIQTELVRYFERISVDLLEIKGLLLVGGGGLPSMRGNAITTNPLSDYFMTFFKKLAPHCELLNTRNVNLRRMNFEGMKIIHKYA